MLGEVIHSTGMGIHPLLELLWLLKSSERFSWQKDSAECGPETEGQGLMVGDTFGQPLLLTAVDMTRSLTNPSEGISQTLTIP